MTPSAIQFVFTSVFAGLLVIAAASDFRSYRIPNWISGALVVIFPVAALFTADHAAFALHLLTALCVLAGGYLLFRRGLMGGGDVKLWSAVALWLGPDLVGPHLVLVAVFGGLLGIVLFVQRTVSTRYPSKAWRSAVPYGIAIAAATLWLLPRIPVLQL